MSSHLLSDTQLAYEQVTTSPALDKGRGEILVARFDGNGFSSMSKKPGRNRPFDSLFSKAMIATAIALVEELHAATAFVQSDEISLYFAKDELPIYGGRFQKISSVGAAIASLAFTDVARDSGYIKLAERAKFDGRAYAVPSADEAFGNFLWRFSDCKRNAISMIAESLLTAKSLVGVPTQQRREMIGKRLDILPAFFDEEIIERYGRHHVFGTLITGTSIVSPVPDDLREILTARSIEVPESITRRVIGPASMTPNGLAAIGREKISDATDFLLTR